MGDLTFGQRTQPVSLFDENTGQSVKIDLIDGEPRLITGGVQSIESLKGFDPICDTWFYYGTQNDSTGLGSPGDQIRVQIAAGDDPVSFPAVDHTYTLQAGDTTEEIAAANHAAALNADSTFQVLWRAQRIANSGCVYITARQPGDQFQRPNVDDFQVTVTTGTTVVTRAFDKIVTRNKVTSLARDPGDPRQGILGISGTVFAGEGDVTGRIIEFATDGGSSDDLRVDGSTTPVDFTIPASATKERFFTSLRFQALGNGIQFTNFISLNQALALNEGVLVTIRSNDSEIDFPELRATEDFASFFSRGASDFDVYDVSGTDYFRATLTFAAPFQLYKAGTFATDDFIRVRIRSDLSSGLSQFKFIGFGFERDF